MLSGVLFGLLPARRARGQRSIGTVESGRSTQGTVALRTGTALVAMEAALATILLVSAGLLLRSLWSMLQVNTGFDAESVVSAEPQSGPRRSEIQGNADDDVPAVSSAGTSPRTPAWDVAAMNVLPLTPDLISTFAATVEDHPRPPEEPQYVLWSTP